MKKNKRTLLSLNRTRISNLNQLSNTIFSGLDSNQTIMDCYLTETCPTYVEGCDCDQSFSCPSSAYVPPTGKLVINQNPTQTNGLPGNDCC